MLESGRRPGPTAFQPLTSTRPNAFGVFGETAPSERQIEQESIDQPTEPAGGITIAPPPGQRRPRENGQRPGQNAPRTPQRTAVEQLFNSVGDTSEANQRVPAPRFAEQPVKQDAGDSGQRQVQRGRHIYRKTGGRKRERHEKIAKTKAEFYAD